jgi:hypothetical protein
VNATRSTVDAIAVEEIAVEEIEGAAMCVDALT